jgi:hypothetical protein
MQTKPTNDRKHICTTRPMHRGHKLCPAQRAPQRVMESDFNSRSDQKPPMFGGPKRDRSIERWWFCGCGRKLTVRRRSYWMLLEWLNAILTLGNAYIYTTTNSTVSSSILQRHAIDSHRLPLQCRIRIVVGRNDFTPIVKQA